MPIKLNLISETTFGIKANGVDTFFKEIKRILKNDKSIELNINKFSFTKKFDVSHSQTIGPLSLLLAKKSKFSIITAHVIPESVLNSLAFDKYFLKFTELYLRMIYNSFDCVVAISDYIKKRLIEIGVNKDKIIVIPNFVDRNKFKNSSIKARQFRKKFNISKDDFVVLCVGQIQPRKGVEDFIETAKKLPNIKFVWVGTRPFGMLTAGYFKLNKLIKNAPKNVIFTGYVDSIIGAYSACDVFFMPTHQDNFPFAILEAASFKKPIVLRNIKEFKSLFKNFAIMTKNFDKEIKHLKDNKKYYRKYAKLSDRLASKYNSKKVIRKYIELYKNANTKSSISL